MTGLPVTLKPFLTAPQFICPAILFTLIASIPINTVLSYAASAIQIATPAADQTIDEQSPYRDVWSYRFRPEINGEFVGIVGDRVKYRAPMALFQLLRNDSVADRLDLLKTQRTQISELHDDLNAAIGDYRRQLRQTLSADGQALIRKLGEAQKLEQEILTQFQAKDLRAVLLQCEIKRIGLLGALHSGRLGQILELTAEDRAALTTAFVKVAPDCHGQLNDFRKELSESLLELLTPAQRDALAEIQGKPEDDSNIGRTWLFYFLATTTDAYQENLKSLHELDTGTLGIKDWPYLVAFLCLREFRVAGEGGIVFEPVEAETDYHKCWLISTTLSSVLRAAQAEDWLSLTAEQNAVREAIDDQRRQAYSDIQAALNAAETNDARRLALETYHNHFTQLMREHLTLLRNTLTAWQLDGLRLLCYRLTIARVGLTNALRFELLGDDLKLTADQQEKLRDWVHDQRAEATVLLEKTEKQVNKELLKILDEPRQKRIAQLIGKELKLPPTSIELLELLYYPFAEARKNQAFDWSISQHIEKEMEYDLTYTR